MSTKLSREHLLPARVLGYFLSHLASRLKTCRLRASLVGHTTARKVSNPWQHPWAPLLRARRQAAARRRASPRQRHTRLTSTHYTVPVNLHSSVVRFEATSRSFVSGRTRPDTHPHAPKRRAWEALTQTNFTHVDGSLSDKVRDQGARPSGAPLWPPPWNRWSRR